MADLQNGKWGDQVIFVQAINRGDAATELTHLVGYVYKSRLHLLLRRLKKPVGQFAVVTNGAGAQLPFRLEPGGRWTGGILQDELVKKFPKSGILRCGVVDTQTGKRTCYLVTVKFDSFDKPRE